ncbi:RNA polymerase III subunit C82 [Recurvomyces mirabilis]|uniref:DNA-directed RNA polymerase III subunit RPC3 n=1 Tax=Recurvomyces mirabilis TaxID=574656 RepID=A0AAE0WIL3_9PEZI|nr:RNA polymerase III subunit C82 [Recurvomyces mirabilis]KAK5150446.1 RNA polymerase III subunit C82 [Recurvomyces mirabilis]
MAQNLNDLLHALVESHTGNLSASIFSTLAHHGRLSLPTLASHAQIPLRRARTGIASLLEEQLVHYIAGEEDSPALYSANLEGAYNLARHMNVVRLVTERHGEAAGQVVKNILQLGNARVGDLAEAYNLRPVSKRDSAISSEHATSNGYHKSKPSPLHHITSASELHNILRTLLQSGILVKVGARAFISASDFKEQIEETVINEQFPDRKVTGPKKQALFAGAVRQLKRKWQSDDAFSEAQDYDSKGTIKRPGQHFTAPNKRAKLNNGLTNGHTDEDSGPKLSSDLIVRVDFTKCTLGLRSLRLQNMAKRFLGNTTAAVYGALLQAIEGKTHSLHVETDPAQDEDDDPEDALPVANTREVAEFLVVGVDLSGGGNYVGKGKRVPNGAGKKRRKNEVIEDVEDDELEDDGSHPTTDGHMSYRDSAKRFEDIEAHLRLLEQHDKIFCKYTRPGIPLKGWRIPFGNLIETLLNDELDATINALYGKIPLRLIRILRDRGKLEEKAIASIAMMRIKDVRGVLAEMQHASLVDAQEVPKENQRQPSKNIYLWYFDTKRAQSLTLQHTYKAMARTLQRTDVEREECRTIIAKAERTDIKGNEAEKLQQGEKQALRAWRETEERLLTQVGRLDDVVAVLRDFSGTDTSLLS